MTVPTLNKDIVTLNKDVVRIIAKYLLDLDHTFKCEEPHLIKHVVRLMEEPTYEHPELLGLYYPGKVVKGKKPTLKDAARRGNMPLMKELRSHYIKPIPGLEVVIRPDHSAVNAAVAFGNVDNLVWLMTPFENTEGGEVPFDWGCLGRFRRKMLDWLGSQEEYRLEESDVVRLGLEWGNLRWAKKFMSRGYPLHDHSIDTRYIMANGATDVLDWLRVNRQLNPQTVLDQVAERFYFGKYSKAGLDWLLANGAVLRENHFSDLCSHLFDFNNAYDELKSKVTKHRGMVFALKWLYENGCPISSECKRTHHRIGMILAKYCKRPVN